MSLINDALKRAKEAHQQQTPVQLGGPMLCPVDHRPVISSRLWLVLAFFVVSAAAVILLWQWLQANRSPRVLASQPPAPVQTTPAHAPPPAALPSPLPKPATPSVSAPESQPEPTVVENIPVQPTEPVTPVVLPPPEKPEVVEASPPVAPPAVKSEPPSANLAARPTVEEKPAEPPPKLTGLKLQGIFYHPTRPSAIINGKSWFIGDRLEGWHVVAIDKASATLANHGHTNVLRLP